MRSRTRFAFTILELLIVISIIALLAQLATPAIQRARETARRNACQSKARQIAIACQQYCDGHGCYPPGQMFGGFGKGPDSTAWSFLARILPFVEENGIYELGDIPRRTLRASMVADRTIELFNCPSDGWRSDGPRFDAGNMIEFAFPVGSTNYKGVSGANWGADGSQGWGPEQSGTNWPNRGTNGSFDGLSDGDGMLFRDDFRVKRRHRHIVDGLSKTFLIGEDLPAKDRYCSWPYANNAYSTCAIPPNNNEEPDPGFWPNCQSFRSGHPDGLNFATVDGSVHFVSDEIALSLYRALATIAGREPVGLGDLK